MKLCIWKQGDADLPLQLYNKVKMSEIVQIVLCPVYLDSVTFFPIGQHQFNMAFER